MLYAASHMLANIARFVVISIMFAE